MPRRKAKPAFSAAVQEDPVEFSKTFCLMPDGSPVVPHPGQIELMHGMGHHTIIAAGRQWGKSFSLALYICWFLVTHNAREVLIVAPTLDQAKLIFKQVERQFRKGPLSVLVEGKVKNSPFPELNLVNGSSCHARGANSPQYIRGRSPHLVIIDEAAFIKDGTIREIEPLMTVTGKMLHSGIIMISTPFGFGEFYDQYIKASDVEGAYRRRHHFTSLDNPHADMEFLEDIKDQYGEDSPIWRTEYLAEFIGNEMAVFPIEDLDFARNLWPEELTFPQDYVDGHSYVSGVDLANTTDFFVQTILDTTNANLIYPAKMHRLQNKGYDYYKDLIRREWASYHQPETMVDSTTLAEVFVEDLRDISAIGYKFTGTTAKYEAVQSLVKLLSEHRLALPSNREILNELKYFTYKVTPSKNLKMEAKRGHDDIVMSLALASMLAAKPHNIGFFMPVSFKEFKKPEPPKPVPQKAGYYDPFKEAFEADWN